MRKILCLLSILLCSAVAPTARAAFPSCEDARNYGENSARLCVGQAFSRIACDGQLLPRVHLALDRMLARQVLRTSDTDEEKLCFYEGMFEGLTEELRSRYAACSQDPAFECLCGESIASHAGSLLSALSLSLRNPSAVDLEALTAVFEAARTGGPVSVCAAAPPSCEGALLGSMSSLARSLFMQYAPMLAELICREESPAGGDGGCTASDGGSGTGP